VHPTLHPNQNHLLAALPVIELDLLIPHLELIHMPLGDALWEAGDRLSYVYFPLSAIISLHHILKDSSSREIASVGREGMLDISSFMGGEMAPSWATVQTSGYSYRLKATLLLQKFHDQRQLQYLLLRYTQAFITQIAQTGVCARHHKAEQQLCCWLLLTLDRLESQELILTHEQIAHNLGVRRERITAIAGKLQQTGIIRYRRGHMTVLDRVGLRNDTCECYDVIKKGFTHVFDNIIERKQAIFMNRSR
jgi:CRP-like cAMP-binding protein